ncbi:MHYT domain-containing protein [Paenibacillus chitinolyticus]|uniref:MHYT domain-containing protein n=1 Tax=Paenibacillus chitinolyticus TaxID=79263 RepID=UPI00363D66AB
MQHEAGNYDALLVILSILMSMTTSCTALDMADRLLRGDRSFRKMLLTAVVTGLGVWSMHFLGMLALKLPFEVHYHLPLLAVSLMLPILAVFLSLLILAPDRKPGKRFFTAVGLLAGLAFVSMHFSGMLAMKIPAVYHQTAGSLIVSIALALLASYLMLALAIYARGLSAYNLLSPWKTGGSMLVGCLIAGMHYTAMAGASFTPSDRELSLTSSSIIGNTLLTVLVGCTTFCVLFWVVLVLYRDRQNVLTASRFNEQRYTALFEHSPDLVICMDPVKKMIVSANPSVYANTGYTQAELMLLSLHDLLYSREEKLKVMTALAEAARGKPSKIEVSIRTKQGARKYHRTSVFPLEHNRHLLVYFVSKDITDRIVVEQELRKAKDLAESAVKTKSEFLDTMSHEIRTPLTGIIGINQLLSESAESPDDQELLALQAKSSQALLRVINDILELSKMEAGRISLHQEPFQLRELIRECLDFFAIIIRNKELAIDTSIDPAVPEILVGDYGRVRQILVNLIGNAVKFTDQGLISLEVRLSERGDEGCLLEFAVSDTGIGIDCSKLDRLFQPFTQLDGASNRKYEGTGLGLAICRKLVTLMQGRIWAVPGRSVGTEFRFTIRLRELRHFMDEGDSKEAG